MKLMKSLLLISTLILAAIAGNDFSLALDRTIKIRQGDSMNIPLKCSNSVGSVSYDVKGLPDGLSYDSTGSIYGSSSNLGFGNYPVLVGARDQGGNSVSQIVVINVGDQGATMGSGLSGLINGGSSLTQSTLSGNSMSSSTTNTSSSSFSNNSNNGQSATINIQGTNNPNANNNNNNADRLNNLLNTLSSSSSTTTTTSSGNGNYPNGNFPNGNFPNGNIPSQGTNMLTSVPNTNNLIYPTGVFPTGRAPDAAPNTVAIRITETQASKTLAGKNIITADDVTRNAIFQRQINANKAIANLLDIIQQRKANINAAKIDITVLETALANATKRQREVQQQIIDAENNRKKLQSAIDNLKNALNVARQELNNLRSAGSTSNDDITMKQTIVNTLQNQINNAQQELNMLEDKKNQLQNALDQVNQQIANLLNEIQTAKTDLTNLRNTVANLGSNINNATNALNNSTNLVNDLTKRLQDAKNQQNEDQKKLNDLNNLKYTAPDRIQQLENTITNKTSQLAPLQDKANQLTNQLNNQTTTINNAKNNIDKITKDLTTTNTTVENTKKNAQNNNDNINKKAADINNALNDLRLLENQIPKFDRELQAAYNAGNDANAALQNAKENLAAIITRLEKESSLLTEATRNLEIARAEKEKADLTMDELLRERSDALPYAVIPNGNLLTNPGTPPGNNPDGSPLGPVVGSIGATGVAATGGINSSSSISYSSTSTSNGQTGSLPFYLSGAYRSGADPARLGTQNSLYPFSIYNIGRGSDFSCSNNQSPVTLEGVIQRIYGNSMSVQDNSGNLYTANVGSCSNMSSTKQNYTPALGDRIKLQGYSTGVQQINLTEGTCY